MNNANAVLIPVHKDCTLSLFQRLRGRLTRAPGAAPSASRPPDPALLESREAITRFLFLADPPEPVDLCFVLGCPTPTNMDPAIALHASGFAPVVMISGHGPARQPVPESMVFRDYAVARGIPAEAMIIETEATNTKENFALSAPIIGAQLGWSRIRRVALVTKPYHMRRAIMTARQHWPAHLRLIALPSYAPDDPLAESWWQTEDGRRYVLQELRAIGTYALQNDIGGF